MADSANVVSGCMLLGHVPIALTSACAAPTRSRRPAAIQSGRETTMKDDWKKIFDDSKLDSVRR